LQANNPVFGFAESSGSMTVSLVVHTREETKMSAVAQQHAATLQAPPNQPTTDERQSTRTQKPKLACIRAN
jgi:hypothetical protein